MKILENLRKFKNYNYMFTMYIRKLKGSQKFQDESERCVIIANLRIVDKVILSIDQDRAVIKTIQKIHTQYAAKYNLCFANGGDQSNDKIPERGICKKLDIKLIDDLGKKIQSSSWLLRK